MKVTLIYFSQTGNTRRVAGSMARAFRESGHDTWIMSIKKATSQDAITCDLLGIGAPCFANHAPTPFKTFLSSLPTLDRKKAFVSQLLLARPVGFYLNSRLHARPSQFG